MGKTCDLFGACLFPQSLVFTFEEVSVLFEFAGVSIENGIEVVKGVYCRVRGTFDFGANQLLGLGR